MKYRLGLAGLETTSGSLNHKVRIASFPGSIPQLFSHCASDKSWGEGLGTRLRYIHSHYVVQGTADEDWNDRFCLTE